MEESIESLKEIARKIRLNTFEAIVHAGGGHFGGSMSTVEILTVLYFDIMKVNPQNPDDDRRDRFILSKGHSGPTLYTTLAVRGYFPISELKNLDKPLSKFPKHIDRLKLKSIEVSSGALGQGLSIACGMAISLKQLGKKNFVYILMSDGELNSGQVWEAAMTASKYRLDNIIAIVDRNNCQVDGPAEKVMPMERLDSKWQSFGWNTYHVDGHDIHSLVKVIKGAQKKEGKPKVIIAKTIKGCGLSFMENDYRWHSGTITDEQYNKCIKDLKEAK